MADIFFDDVNTTNLKIVYIIYIGKNADNLNVYHFLLSSCNGIVTGSDLPGECVITMIMRRRNVLVTVGATD